MNSVGLIGLGNMGAAIARGLLGLEDVEVVGYDVDAQKVSSLSSEGMTGALGVPELARASDYIVLAVKPHLIAKVAENISGELGPDKCLVSIAAGIKSASIARSAGNACPVVRVMPNTPALVRAGVFAVCLEDEKLSQEQREFVPRLFESLGQVQVLEEKYFDAFTAVAGSGPAYVFTFMEAVVEAGVTLGLTRDQCNEMVKGLFTGSARLAQESGHSITDLRKMVTSPGGTTIQALNHLARTGVPGHIIDAVTESYIKSIELGQEED
jgi:pyrroline-5-carboxylate reductase